MTTARQAARQVTAAEARNLNPRLTYFVRGDGFIRWYTYAR